MVSHVDLQVIETLGEINYSLLCELTELWVLKEYLDRKNAFLAFCIVKPGSPSMRMISWHGDLFDPMTSSIIVNAATDSYIDVPQMFNADQKKSTYIYYDIAITKESETIGINHCFILRLDDYSVYAFAFNNNSIDYETMRMLMYEYSYGICRMLAPKSQMAFSMVNGLYPYHDMKFEKHKGYESKLINHIERAFCCKKLPSIEAWRNQ